MAWVCVSRRMHCLPKGWGSGGWRMEWRDQVRETRQAVCRDLSLPCDASALCDGPGGSVRGREPRVRRHGLAAGDVPRP
eukprot:968932-Alexandrium_andersonii.AAC.1